jgi:hypothetical protein
MTALSQYARLESTGFWRPDATADWREVVVTFGDASLMIRETGGRALAHWSLAAVVAVARDQGTTYAPAPDSPEALHLTDPTLIDAIDKVRRVIDRARPRAGRVRFLLWGTAFLLMALVVGTWLPGALQRQTLSAVPHSARVAIGMAMLGHLQQTHGTACEGAVGREVLDRLSDRLFPGRAVEIVVLPQPLPQALLLPGGIIVMSRNMLAAAVDPNAFAGRAVAAIAGPDPMASLLEDAGLWATFGLLTTGGLPDPKLEQHVRALSAEKVRPLPVDVLVPAFAAAQVPLSPYAYVIDETGETVLPLIEADALRPAIAEPAISPPDWAGLQGICQGRP